MAWSKFYIYVWRGKGAKSDEGFSNTAPGPADIRDIRSKKLTVLEISIGNNEPEMRISKVVDKEVEWETIEKIEPMFQHIPPSRLKDEPEEPTVSAPKKKRKSRTKAGRYETAEAFAEKWPDKEWQGDMFYTSYGNPDGKKNEAEGLPKAEEEPEEPKEPEEADEDENIEFESETDSDTDEMNLDDDDEESEEEETESGLPRRKRKIRERFTKRRRIQQEQEDDDLEFDDGEEDNEEEG